MGLVDGCQALGTPVTGGNVSFYNQTGTTPILPTPTVGMLGVIDNVADRIPMGFRHPGDALVLLGSTRDDLSGSVWADVVHDGHLGGMPPMPDFAAEQALAKVMSAAAKEKLLTSAHDLADGGLLMALVESSLRHDMGAALTLPAGDPTVQLFSESVARALVTLPGASLPRFQELCAEHGVPLDRIGEVTGEAELEIQPLFSLDLAQVRQRWSATLPAVLG